MKNAYRIDGNVVYVEAKIYGQVHEFMVDLEDFDLVNSIPNTWYLRDVKNRPDLIYVYYQPYIDGKRTSVNLHQYLMGTFGQGNKTVVDHIDGDTLNNCRSNLQYVSQKVNVNKGRTFVNNKTGHKNIEWQESRKRFRVQFYRDNKYTFIGRYKTIEEAIEARDNYLKEELK
jgi:hypothetical protein